MTFNNLINHMQNLNKESLHLTLPGILKEHVQYCIQQQASYIAVVNISLRTKWDLIYLSYLYSSKGICVSVHLSRHKTKMKNRTQYVHKGKIYLWIGVKFEVTKYEHQHWLLWLMDHFHLILHHNKDLDKSVF